MGAFPSGARGRARAVGPHAVSAIGICDRCGFRYTLIDLQFQVEWGGAALINTGSRVCPPCFDEPNPQLRAYSPPPDPVPVLDPRPDYANIGNAPVVVITGRANSPVWLRNDLGNLILTDQGFPINIGADFQPVLPADPTRTYVAFAIPPVAGLWISAAGGSVLALGAVFYPPGSAFVLQGPGAAGEISIACAVAGLVVIIETQTQPGSMFNLDVS